MYWNCTDLPQNFHKKNPFVSLVAKPPERSVGKLQRNCVHLAPYTKDTHGWHCFRWILDWTSWCTKCMYLHPIIIHIYIYPYAFTKFRRLFMFGYFDLQELQQKHRQIQHPASLVTLARPPQKPLRSSSPCLSRECEMEMMQKISMMMPLLTQFILEVSGFISFDLGQFGPTTTSKHQ